MVGFCCDNKIVLLYLLTHVISNTIGFIPGTNKIVAVDISKLTNFLKWHKSTLFCFTVMCIVWFITRLIILPFVIFRSILFESSIVLVEKSVPPEMYFCYRPMFNILTGGIILLHFIWFMMFIEMWKVFFKLGEQHDLTEYKKGEKASREKKN